jgi:dihydropteroate synthase
MSDKDLIFPPPLTCRSRVFDFSRRSYIMGILNVTPDSFSDGNAYYAPDKAVARGLELAGQGADIIDVGGESTRPGAAPVSCEEELRRVIPVVRELARQARVPISIDTTKAEVARRALDAGAEIINDISALRFDEGMARVAAQSGVPVVLMHMRGTPQTMQQNVCYADLIREIREFLEERICFAVAAGIERAKIIVDPGLGFGKSVARDNFTILDSLRSFAALGQPLLVGPSRKAFIGKALQQEATDRDWGTAAAVAVALYNGAHIVRVHAVQQMQMVARVADELRRAGQEKVLSAEC